MFNRILISGLTLVFIFVASGELTRLPFGPENGFLPNDFLVPLITFSWLIKNTFIDRKWPTHPLWKICLTFVGIAIISFLAGSTELSMEEFAKSGFFFIRLMGYGLLLFMGLDLYKKEGIKNKIFRTMTISAILLAIIGFIQWRYFPDFTEQQDYGWDPHIGRLLSTWFDPNFIGGLFAFLLCITVSKILDSKTTNKLHWVALSGLFLLTLGLTYSRSAYLAAFTGLGIIGLLRSRKLIAGGIIALLILIAFSDRAEERITNLYYSAKSMVGLTAELPDATARLRLNSWEGAVTIFKDHPWLGVGYNTYAYAQARYGFVKELKDHASTGADSTLLTIAATTGSLGLLAYIWILIIILVSTYKRRENPWNLGAFAGTIGLLVHSIFVNSLLFPPLLIFYTASLAIALTENDKK